jgi:hypothetical protein
LGAYTAPVEVVDSLDFVVGGRMFPLLNHELKVTPKPVVLKETEKAQKLARSISLGPRLIRLRYNISNQYVGRHPGNRQAVVEFQEQFFNPQDLDKFFLEIVGGNFNSTVAKIVRRLVKNFFLSFFSLINTISTKLF